MKLVLCTNNKYEDPFLHSQLLYIYENIEFIKEKILFCRNNKDNLEKVINISYGKFSFFIYFLKLFLLILKIDTKDTIFHVRGYVSGFIFFLVTRIVFWKKIFYIYDPRGAFVVELKESKFNDKENFLLKILKYIEKSLICSSFITIVTSDRFKELYSKEYGNDSKYLVLYNTSAFENYKFINKDIINKDIINICYMGSIDFWHNLDEIVRVFKYLQDNIPNKTNIYFFTNFKDKELIIKKLNQASILNYDIGFVPYNEVQATLLNMDICISIVVPTESQKIASPIKVSDYIQLNKIVVMNKNIGDFDNFFIKNNSAMIYDYGKELSFSFNDLLSLNIESNEVLKERLNIKTNIKQLLEVLSAFQYKSN